MYIAKNNSSSKTLLSEYPFLQKQPTNWLKMDNITRSKKENNMGTFKNIESYGTINAVDIDKVNTIAELIKNNGWIGAPILFIDSGLITGSHRIGAPILFIDSGLITGSHRIEALRLLDNEGELDFSMEVCEDVTDIVDAAFDSFINKYGYAPDMDYSNLGWIFEGTWVEEYKKEINEW